MKHIGKTAFARTEEVRVDGPDKWALLDCVTLAAPQLGLSHRTIGVLRALLSFLPSRTIPMGMAAVVFPANKTLSDRLHGMPESTLRRHLATLVRCGIVNRHDSPNRKRYARRAGPVIALAFGFDLSPLMRRAAELQTLAEETQQQQDTLRIMRDHILCLRHQLIQRPCSDITLIQETTRVLRRVPDVTTYQTLIDALTAACATEDPPKPTVKMSDNDSENERHIEPQTNPNLRKAQADDQTRPQLSTVLSQNSELSVFFPEQIATWADFITVTNQAATILGIDPSTLSQCKERFGPEETAMLVAYVLQNADTIMNPRAYTWKLLRDKAGQGHRAFQHNEPAYCQLTI